MSRHRGATTDVYPPDARDPERNRSTWHFEDLEENPRCPDTGRLIGLGAHGVTPELPLRMRSATHEQIAVPKPLQEWELLAGDTAQTCAFSWTNVSGVQTPTRALSTVTALDRIQVNTTWTSGDETPVGEVELCPAAVRAKGDRELNAESAEQRSPGKETEETKDSRVALRAERPGSPDTTWEKQETSR